MDIPPIVVEALEHAGRDLLAVIADGPSRDESPETNRWLRERRERNKERLAAIEAYIGHKITRRNVEYGVIDWAHR